VALLDDETRDAAESIIGNLDEDGYLTATLDEMAHQGGTSREVFWVPVSDEMGGAFAVASDVRSGAGLVLPRGRYAWCGVLAAGAVLPSLDDLLADPARVDLGQRFPLPA